MFKIGLVESPFKEPVAQAPEEEPIPELLVFV
jgi:hypothetical protein